MLPPAREILHRPIGFTHTRGETPTATAKSAGVTLLIDTTTVHAVIVIVSRVLDSGSGIKQPLLSQGFLQLHKGATVNGIYLKIILFTIRDGCH